MKKIILLLLCSTFLYFNCSKTEMETAGIKKPSTWDEVINDPEYQAFNPSSKSNLRERYFNNVIWKKEIPDPKSKEYSEYSSGLNEFKESARQKEKDAGLKEPAVDPIYAKKILGTWNVNDKAGYDTKLLKLVFEKDRAIRFYTQNEVFEDSYFVNKECLWIGNRWRAIVWVSDDEFYISEDNQRCMRVR